MTPPPNRKDNAQTIEATAPYRFVPPSAAVHFPDWSDEVSHDVPFLDGIVGTIDLRLTAETPLLIADDAGREGERKGAKAQARAKPAPVRRFVKLDGRPAVPGSAIRGMLRNVVEIAAFGKLGQWVDERRMSVRDLNNTNLYTRHISENTGGGYRARSQAAWLDLASDGGWQLRPCAHARVRIDELLAYGETTRSHKNANFAGRPNANKKYRAWGYENSDLTIKFDVSEEGAQANDGGLVFRRATNLGRGLHTGTLVFTGQPSDYNNPKGKKRDFIFFDEEPTEPIPVSRKQQREFEQVHSQGERHGEPEPNEDWDFFRKWLTQGRRVPVFYLEDAPSGLAFGLAQMFRLPYRLTLHDAIGNTHADHLSDRPDLAELIFGYVRRNDRDALRGRISFEPLWLESDLGSETPTHTVLMGPRPSFYPYYIAQPKAQDGRVENYATLMDEDAELAGWKRYPVRPPSQVAVASGNSTDSTVSVLEPMKSGTTFTGRVHVHNLRPVELGAVLWAVTWGSNPGHRHALGMGKALGFGQVRLEIVAHDLENITGEAVSPEQFAELLRKFEEHMEQAVGRGRNCLWRESEQIFHLLTLADPTAAKGKQLKHPVLDTKGFTEIKKRHQILSPLRDFTGRTDRSLRRRKTAEEKRQDEKRRLDEQRRIAEERKRSEQLAAAQQAEAEKAARSPTARFLEDSQGRDEGVAWKVLLREVSHCRSAEERISLIRAGLEHPKLGQLLTKWKADEPQTPIPGSAEFEALNGKKQEAAQKKLENIKIIRRLESGEAPD